MLIPLTAAEHEAREKARARKPAVIAKTERYPEKLARGESVAMIQYQHSYMCSLHCEHCSIAVFQGRRPAGARPLTHAKLRSVYDEADRLGHGQTTISGGEPLIFKDLFQVIEAIGPERFFIQVDTAGYHMTAQFARDLYAAGVDKIQVSLDSSIAAEHDEFRRTPDAHRRAVAALAHSRAAGMSVVIATVITRQRIRTKEFRDFLDFAKANEYPVATLWPKLTGNWEGAADALPLPEDIAYVGELGKEYFIKDRTSPWFGLDVGCNAVKRSITLTDVGNIFGCHWQYWSLGNVWDEPLETILKKGMRYYGKRTEVCSVSQDHAFITKYVHKTFNRTSTDPVLTVEEVLGRPEDFDAHVPVRVGSPEAVGLPVIGRQLPVLEVA